METNNTNMKDIGEGTIRQIDWQELTPIVLLLRIFNVTLGFRVLAFALIGLWLTVLLNFCTNIPLLSHSLQTAPDATIRVNIPLDTLYATYLEATFLLEQNSWGFLWLLGVGLIWIFCGGMICRIVAVRLTIDESEPTKNLFLFFCKRGISFVSSILILSLGILCCFLPVKIAGWLMAVPIINYIVAVLFPIPLIFAFFTVILTLGLAIGWMLLFAAVSTDGSDGFDAISRCFSYIFQRPLHYILYWVFSAILGWLGFVLVQFLTQGTVYVCWNIMPEGFWGIFWLYIVESVAVAYLFTWFWTSSVAIYLLLRRSVDATPFDEVYRITPPVVRTLPPIKKDEHGAPEIVPLKES